MPQWLWSVSGFQLSCRERGWLRPGAGSWDLESLLWWQQVWDTAPYLGFCFMLTLLRTAGRGCPVVVCRCFGEGFISFWSCACL